MAFCQDSQRGTKLLLGTATVSRVRVAVSLTCAKATNRQHSVRAQGTFRRSVKFVTEAGRHQGEGASRALKYKEYKDANIWICHISLFKVS